MSRTFLKNMLYLYEGPEKRTNKPHTLFLDQNHKLVKMPIRFSLTYKFSKIQIQILERFLTLWNQRFFPFVQFYWLIISNYFIVSFFIFFILFHCLVFYFYLKYLSPLGVRPALDDITHTHRNVLVTWHKLNTSLFSLQWTS